MWSPRAYRQECTQERGRGWKNGILIYTAIPVSYYTSIQCSSAVSHSRVELVVDISQGTVEEGRLGVVVWSLSRRGCRMQLERSHRAGSFSPVLAATRCRPPLARLWGAHMHLWCHVASHGTFAAENSNEPAAVPALTPSRRLAGRRHSWVDAAYVDVV